MTDPAYVAPLLLHVGEEVVEQGGGPASPPGGDRPAQATPREAPKLVHVSLAASQRPALWPRRQAR